MKDINNALKKTRFNLKLCKYTYWLMFSLVMFSVVMFYTSNQNFWLIIVFVAAPAQVAFLMLALMFHNTIINLKIYEVLKSDD
jgi:hypothetical protein